MSAACATWIRGMGVTLGLVASLAFATAVHAEDAAPLASVVQRAIAYDLAVRAAQARLDGLTRRPADPPEAARNRRSEAFPTTRPAAPADAAGPEGGRAAIEAAERELRRSRDLVAGRVAVAALDLQRHDRLVALARQRVADLQRTAAEPPRRGKPATAAPAAQREIDTARRRAESALVDAQAARLMAVDRLEAIAGHLPSGVAAFEWPATAAPNPVGDEAMANERAEQLARQLRMAHGDAAAPAPKPAAAHRGIAQAIQAREALHDLEVRAVDARHDLALARLREQLRLGTWQQALADAPPATTVAEAPAASPAPAPSGGTVDPALETAFRQWADAWRQKNLARYLASYSNDFAPAGMSRDAWRAQRVARLSRPGPIELAIERVQWQPKDAATAEVRFSQRFRSPAYSDASDKRIVWRNGPAGWRIVEETSRIELSEREGRRRPG